MLNQFMFFSWMVLGILLMFVVLWSDYMKLLIFMELVSLIFLSMVMIGMKFDVFSMNFFFSCLIFLVCESSMGFLIFIFYISMENDVVKKMNLIQY